MEAVQRRAIDLVRDGAISSVPSARSYLVRSQSDAERLYVVTLGQGIAARCDCEARRHGETCKHILAVSIREERKRRDEEELLRERFSDEGDPYDESGYVPSDEGEPD